MTDLFWLSFCDVTRTRGQQFLGACCVEGKGIAAALAAATVLGINPGGEVEGVQIDAATTPLVPEKWRNRLLSHEECGSMDKEMEALQKAAGVETPDDLDVSFICQAHNEVAKA